MNFICDCEEGYIYEYGQRCPYCGVTYTNQTEDMKEKQVKDEEVN